MPPVEAAPLTTSQAYLLGLALTFIYVGSLYVSKNARLSFSSKSSSIQGPRSRGANERWRDDPDVIRARITAVTIATALCTAVVWIVVWKSVYSGNSEVRTPHNIRFAVSLSNATFEKTLYVAGRHALEVLGLELQLPSPSSMKPISLWNTLSQPQLLKKWYSERA
ncbi:CAAX prenyl protease [Marasmius tenuissimus]|uniref:CAAX prenyl protease n=1 Tax=Marasmius tenuissimus TaxID=585030 RepID=A0ABR3A9Y8_9AGAR